MIDFNKMISTVSNSGLGTGLAGGVAGGALVTALSSKSGRKAATTVAKVGGLAAVGALAWTAYKKYQGNTSTGSTPTPAKAGPTGELWQQLPQQEFESLATNQHASEGLLVLRTMISAAMADGHLGQDEQAHIFRQLEKLRLTAEERSLLFDELRNPRSAEELVASVSDPILAIEVYTAALMTVDSNCQTAQSFLGELANGLNLPQPLLASIHNSTTAALLASA